jgi:hypothetical protein
MAVVQAFAKVFRVSDGVLLGSGRCAIHLSDAAIDSHAPVSGTIVVEWPGGERPELADERGHRIELEDGRWLHVALTKRSALGDGPEALRFRGVGPLRPPEAMP